MFENNPLVVIAAFIVVLTPLILIHELGHFLAAKSVGITILVGKGGRPEAAVERLQLAYRHAVHLSKESFDLGNRRRVRSHPIMIADRRGASFRFPWHAAPNGETLVHLRSGQRAGRTRLGCSKSVLSMMTSTKDRGSTSLM